MAENRRRDPSPQEDVFNHGRIAIRIADLIAQTAEGGLGRCPTFALVGELGSGKSSVMQLVRYELRERGLLGEFILMIGVSLWPFDSPEAAVLGILSAIRAEFAKITSTSSISNAPVRYLKAVEKLDARLAVLSELFAQNGTPRDALDAYNNLAELVGVHVVVWIEDIERFERSGDATAARLGPVRALLYQLQRLERLTVVLASDTLKARVDLEKIARFVERIPQLDTEATWRVISRFRDGCLAMLGSGTGKIEPASKEARLLLSRAFSKSRYGPVMPIQRAVVHLCRTPRVLKNALRATDELWGRLGGEVDFDDARVMSVVRVARPDIFALIDEHIGMLRERRPGRRPETQKADGAFEISLAQSIGDDEPTKLAIDEVLNFVFPKRPSARWSIVDNCDKPQGLGAIRHRDYWPLFLGSLDLMPDERDQRILASIDEWNAGRSDTLVSIIGDPVHSEAVHDFVRLLAPETLPRLLEAVVERRIGESPAQWSKEGAEDNLPGVIAVCRLCQDKLEVQELDQELLAKSVEASLRVSVPRTLRVAQEIMDLFVASSLRRRMLLENDKALFIISVLEALLLGLSANPEDLMMALQDASDSTMFQICWRRDRIASAGHLSGIPFEGWPVFAQGVLKAAKLSPRTMVPQLLPFLVSYSDEQLADGTVRQSATINRTRAERLFGLTNLSEVFASDRIDTDVPQSFAAQIRLLRRELMAREPALDLSTSQ